MLRFDDGREDVSELLAEFERFGAPIEVQSFDDPHAIEVYEGYELFLLRPDLHIVWRGRHAPEDPAALVSLATGH